MAEFKTLKVVNFATVLDAKSTPDSIYWSDYSFPTTCKENGPATHVHFPADLNDRFAVASSSTVKVYSTVTREPIKIMDNFRETAYGASFRADGKLLACGGGEGIVRVFEVDSKSALREFRGTHSAVHLTRFMNDGQRLLSFGDNKSVVLWDVPGEAALQTFQEHTDYVRAGTVCQASNDIFVSGCYDGKVRMFDVRTKKSTLTLDQEVQVEDVLIFPSGGIIVSCGGDAMSVWDVCGGKLLARLSNHHKDIKCLSFASQYTKILSGSLDRHVKVYDVSRYQVVHTLDFPSPILSLGVSGNDDTLVVGMSSGLLSIQNRKIHLKEDEVKKSWEPRPKSTSAAQVKARTSNKRQEMPYDKFLRKFEVTKALDYVLRHHVNRSPEICVALIQDLMRREALRSAVAGRQDKDLDIMLVFIHKHIDNPAYCRVLVDFTNIFLEVYGPSILDDDRMTEMVKRINLKMSRQLESMDRMMEINGMIDTLLSSSKTPITDQPLTISAQP